MTIKNERRHFLKAGAGVALAGLASSGLAANSCGGLSRADFDQYIALFNANDPAFMAYYHPDVVLELGASQITTAAGIGKFYQDVKSHIHESLEITQFISDETGIAVALPTTFKCYKDWDDSFWGRPLKAGEVMRITSFVLYQVEGGKFKHIRSARYSMTNDWQMEG